MREVIISATVRGKIADLEAFLKDELKLSKEAARQRSDRMRLFVLSLATEVDYPLCRFRRWRKLGWRCAVFEKDWVLAYEVLPEGVIVRDMSHTKLLKS
jgi:hypothetical protein